MSDAQSSRIPVSIITGFLGSGKTTLLSKLVRHPALARTAVVVNEFGEVGLDHMLVARSSENTVLLDSGCVCCTVRGDLVDTLRDLFLKRVRGEVTEFDRVVIETTGLADPAPILHTLMTDPLVSARFRLDGVIATVDAYNGDWQLDAQYESVKQAAVADRIVLTKSDIAEPDLVERLTRRLKSINPSAPFHRASHGEIAPELLFNAGLYNPETKGPDVLRWLREEADATGHGHGGDHRDHDHCDHDHHDHDHHDHEHRHDDAIRSFTIMVDQPLNWHRFASWMDMLATLRGPDLLRIKGILDIEDSDRPIVIHGVQHIFHPPVELDSWPTDDHRSKIVFITRDISRDVVLTMFRAAVLDAEPVAASSVANEPLT